MIREVDILAKQDAADLAQTLAQTLATYLAEHPRAAFLEGGKVLFDLPASHFSLATQGGRCVLHLWSGERNMVRTVIGLSERQEKLRIEIRRLGTNRAQSLELIPGREVRTPTVHAASRAAYARLVKRILNRSFPDWNLHDLRQTMDLEHSFGPAYVRGVLTRGQSSWAVIATGADETSATIDGSLTAGILWLAYCRERFGRRTVCSGLKVLVPRGSESTLRARMAWLDHDLAGWELYTVSDLEEDLRPVDIREVGNLDMRLTQAFDESKALERMSKGIEKLMALIPEAMRSRIEIRAKSPSEVALSFHGLEFAQVRQGFRANSFVREDAVAFGVAGDEISLIPRTEQRFSALAEQLFRERSANGCIRDFLFRSQPEKWLQWLLSAHADSLGGIENSLASELGSGLSSGTGFSRIYSQVPAVAGSDRNTLDLLTVNRDLRLAVLELKAAEDLHLPLQGLDYWIRVRFLNLRRPGERLSDLQRNGYFPGITVAAEAPLLYYVVPALHVHPSMETVLAYFSKEVPWVLVAINEGWRSGPKAVYRKRAVHFPEALRL